MKEYANPTWQCEHCGRLFSHKANAARHEAVCRKNPNVEKLCYSCKHFENGDCNTEPVEVWHDSIRGDSFSVTKQVQQNKCTAIDCLLYNPYHMSRDLIDALDDNGYVNMPTINDGCEKYERYDN